MNELRIGLVYEELKKEFEEKVSKENQRVVILDISPKQDNEYKI